MLALMWSTSGPILVTMLVIVHAKDDANPTCKVSTQIHAHAVDNNFWVASASIRVSQVWALQMVWPQSLATPIQINTFVLVTLITDVLGSCCFFLHPVKAWLRSLAPLFPALINQANHSVILLQHPTESQSGLISKSKIVQIAAHSWDNIPWEFPGCWNVLLARIDSMTCFHECLELGDNRIEQ